MKPSGSPNHGNHITVHRSTIKIMATILLFVATQTVAGVVWGASLSAKVEQLQNQVVQLRADTADATRDEYTAADASRDRSMHLELLKTFSQRLDLAERRIERLEERQ